MDRFQIEAARAVDAGSSVLVAAPTGSGKTVVAELAIERCLRNRQRAFYTTPIKALSNQKYRDLCELIGSDRVGLLTGDTKLSPDADVIVMTTEVLRNMLYAESSELARLGLVVLDEVHFLQDRYRGPVWEEIIINLRHGVQVVALSATVSNADQLCAWMDTVRGNTTLVVEDRRPIELVNLFAATEKATRQLNVVPVVVENQANPLGKRFDKATSSRSSDRRNRERQRFSTPSRQEVVEYLADQDELPAIVFVFSRKGCDEAARTLAQSGLVLTTGSEGKRIAEIVVERTGSLASTDLAALEYERWLGELKAGIAAHHAGMVPPFKEAVEQCFVEGLVKVVFATETLALGINMPARTVVIEVLSKFTGETHESLTPGQYAQLTGRAGRRGLDETGQALVLWSPYTRFQDAADLALSRDYELRSAFRPTYNMVANLIRRHNHEEAKQLFGRSFAQFQLNRDVVRFETRKHRRSEALKRLLREAECEFGDVDDYRRSLNRSLPDVSRRDVLHSLARLRPGDVVDWNGQRAAIVSVGWRGEDRAKVAMVTVTGHGMTIQSADIEQALKPTSRIELPQPFQPGTAWFQAETAGLLRRARDGRSRASRGEEIFEHPVEQCPELRMHLRALDQADRVRREVADLDTRIAAPGANLSAELDRVIRLLDEREMTTGWSLTDAGKLLGRVFHECDLLIVESLENGLFDGLSGPELAALCSFFTYEQRTKYAPPAPKMPTHKLTERLAEALDIADDLRICERQLELAETREPDGAFAPTAYRWASGGELAVLLDEDLTGGDFVRQVRQVVDLLNQIGQIAPTKATRRVANEASDAMNRGVVSASIGTG